MSPNFSLLALCCSVLFACSEDINSSAIIEFTHDTRVGKSDTQVSNLVLQEVENLEHFEAVISTDRALRGGVAILTSSSDYFEYLGTEVPTTIDFSTQWVGFYGLGSRSTGGHSVSVPSIQYSERLETLYVQASIKNPGNDCFVTQIFTTPYTLVRFRIPPTPIVQGVLKETMEDYNCTVTPPLSRFLPEEGMQCNDGGDYFMDVYPTEDDTKAIVTLYKYDGDNTEAFSSIEENTLSIFQFYDPDLEANIVESTETANFNIVGNAEEFGFAVDAYAHYEAFTIDASFEFDDCFAY